MSLFSGAAKSLWVLWLLASVEDMIVLSSGREAAKINVYCEIRGPINMNEEVVKVFLSRSTTQGRNDSRGNHHWSVVRNLCTSLLVFWQGEEFNRLRVIFVELGWTLPGLLLSEMLNTGLVLC